MKQQKISLRSLEEQRQYIYGLLEKKQYTLAEKAILEMPEQKMDIQKEKLGLLTSLYIEMAEPIKAVNEVQELLANFPQDGYGLFLLARIHFMAGKRLQVIDELEHALKKGQNINNSCREKIYNLLGQCWRYLGDSERSTKAYLQASRTAEDSDLQIMEYSNYLFNLHYLSQLPCREYIQAHKHYQKFFHQVPRYWHRRREEKKKLRIGYISPDFRNHVVLRFSYALLAAYNHNDFEVWCYAKGEEDAYTHKAFSQVDGWRNISGLSAAAAARCIYEDQIDILFDLAGHTKHNCLPIMAYKPAPVQISGIGYFATTGLDSMDYFLGDSYLDLSAENRSSVPCCVASPFFTEKLLVLPHSHFCYTPLYQAPQTQGAPCKKNGYVTFGSFNNFTKINDEVLLTWQRILEGVPQSRLLLKAAVFDTEPEAAYIKSRISRAGIDLTRVEVRGFSKDYLHEYLDVDIALDTWPYPGGGTTADALYMGVPVLTMQGDSHGARFGYSLLQNAGLSECCAANVSAYIERAVSFAGDFELLDALHRNLRKIIEKSPLMDRHAYLNDMETGYRLIWKNYCAAQSSPAYREISRLLPAMKKFLADHDIQQALAVADFILSARPMEHYTLDTLLEIYIDADDLEKSVQVIDLLQMAGELSGYDCFLIGRTAYLKKEWLNAEQYCRQALEKKDLVRWQENVVHNLLGTIYRDIGHAEQAVDEYRKAMELGDNLAEKAADYSNYLFTLHYLKKAPQFMYEAAKGYDALFKNIKVYEHGKRSHKKLRIGYISPDFHSHVVALFSQAFFKNHDKNRFLLYGYANCQEDQTSLDIKVYADVWRNIYAMKATDVAQLIYRDEIDILVDLAGHTRDNCLPVLAFRPAPIQISGIGYFNTTGLKQVDYFLADTYTDPISGEGCNDMFFTEKLLRLPQSHFCYAGHKNQRLSVVAPVSRHGYITFGSFNNFSKWTDEILILWGRILQAVPKSRLFLKTAFLGTETGREIARLRLKKAGIPLERTVLEGYTVSYLSSYEDIDIALDTYPYPGGGTTCDALYMGVPVITMVGQRHNARFGYSLLMNIALEECCAFTDEEYVQAAVRLAGDETRLKKLRQTLRRSLRQSPVMDAETYMAELENKYESIWQQWLLSESTVIQQHTVQQDFQKLLLAVQNDDCSEVISTGCQMIAREEYPVQVLSVLGNAYSQQKNYKRAVYWLKQAVEHDVENRAGLYLILGRNQQELREDEAAAVSFQLAEKYGRHGSKIFKKELLVRQAALMQGEPVKAAEIYHHAYLYADNLADCCNIYSAYLLSLHYADLSSVDIRKAESGYADIFRSIVPYKKYLNKAGHKIRIGYISKEFCQHELFNFYYALLARYDSSHFEVYCYQLNEEDDGYTRALQPVVDSWKKLDGISHEAAAAAIHRDGIDILFDLDGQTSPDGLRILAWKPAPVQVTGIGYSGDTGLPTIDYFIADSAVLPDEKKTRQSLSGLLELNSQFCYVAREDVPEPKGAPCIQNDCITYGVFQYALKLNEGMLDAWKEILERVPASRLLLYSGIMKGDAADAALYQRLANMGIDMERVCFGEESEDAMSRYLNVDIVLDTWPRTGKGVICEALYMGVPVITLYGNSVGTRSGLSILQAAGLKELAVSTVEEYVDRAVSIASDSDLLNTLHCNLRAMLKKSRLMDAVGYVHCLEKQYQNIYRRRQERDSYGRF